MRADTVFFIVTTVAYIAYFCNDASNTWGIVILGILLGLSQLMFYLSTSYLRAERNGVYGVKHGMGFCLKTNRIIGTETDILLDPRTGIKWLGETRYT